MPFDIDFDTIIKLVAPVLVAIVGAIVKRVVEGRPRLITYLVHAAAHPLPPATAPATNAEQNEAMEQVPQPQPGFVHTHAIVVKNTGKRTAHNVRIDHAVFPPSYLVSPTVHHTVTPGQGGSAEICVPVLVPGEQITISYLYFPPLLWSQIVGPIKSDEAMARAIQTIPTAPPPRAVVWLIWLLVFIGASALAYWLLRLLPLLLN